MGFEVNVRSLFSTWILGSSLLFAQGISSKKFDIETGSVLFKIKGSGTLTEDIHISIVGKGELHFTNRGEVAVVKEQYTEITSGVIQHINKVHLFEKFEGNQHFEVDYKTEKILERAMPEGNFKDYYLKGLVKTGTDTIAGHKCELWEAEGIKKCLHKGIPLLIEHYILGVYYEKRAVEVKLSGVSEAAEFDLPEYPVEKFALFTTNMKTKNIKLPNELSQRILAVSKEAQKSLKKNQQNIDDLSDVQKREIFDKLGQHLFESQKQFIPEFLNVMKEARLCLEQANDVAQSNVCISDVVHMKTRVSGNIDNQIDSWDEENRSKILDSFDDSITLLESKMKCIRASQNLHDLSNCMKTE